MPARSPLLACLALLVALFVTLFALLGTPSLAAAAPPADPTTVTADAQTNAELDERGYVRVPELSERARAWYRFGNLRWTLGVLFGLLVPGVILMTGFSAKLRDRTSAWGRRPWVALLSFLALYSVIVFLAELPLSYWGSYMLPHEFGLSEQRLGKWLGDELKGLMLGVFALWLFVPGTLWFIRKSPDRWWVWTSLVAIPIAFLLLMLTPVFIAPLFNDFGPMKDPSLEAEILALAERAGIEGSRVFEVEKSLDTNTVNAYVTGLGSTKRIVLWDTIIARLERDELLVVMGHEMGHYVLGHVISSMMLLALAIPLTLYLFHTLARRLIARYRARFGFDTFGDVAALPLFSVLITAFSLAVAPLSNVWSRHQEHESDRFALEITHDNHACARAFAELARSNLGNPRPGPLFVLWRASHPPLGDRIDFCNEYRPWETGEPERYQDLFRE
jgi:Zn-dependent protease with chaperone function